MARTFYRSVKALAASGKADGCPPEVVETGSRPTYANRWGLTLNVRGLLGKPRASLDWISLQVGTLGSLSLGRTFPASPEVPHGRQTGFDGMELRQADGGLVKRAFHPIGRTAVGRYGQSLESWDFEGAIAALNQSKVRGALSGLGENSSKASRLDMCFDSECEEALTPRQFLESNGVMEHAEAAKFAPRMTGEIKACHTMYVGSSSSGSAKFVRVYRKDWQPKSGVVVPTMRVEVVFRADEAERAWPVFLARGVDGVRQQFCGALAYMTGIQFDPDAVDWVPMQRKPVGPIAARGAHAIRQVASLFVAWQSQGIDPMQLCRDFVNAQGDVGRKRRQVTRQLVSEVASSGGPEGVEANLRAILAIA